MFHRRFSFQLNVFILANVARVLFTHLAGNEDSDVHQIRYYISENTDDERDREKIPYKTHSIVMGTDG